MNAENHDRVTSLHQLLDFEQYKLAELQRQQNTERTLPNGHPEMLAPDIESCKTMIRIWTDRLALPALQLEPLETLPHAVRDRS